MIISIRSSLFLAVAGALALGTTAHGTDVTNASHGTNAGAAAAGPGPSTASDLAELTPWPATRYEKLMRKSPFAPATAAPVQAATPGFAANLYISGLGKIGDRDFVSISSRDQTTKFSLYGSEPTSDGIQLLSVQWSDAVGKSKVTIKKGSEVAILEYDQALLQKPVAVTPVPVAAGQQPMPGQLIARPNLPRPGWNPNQPKGNPVISPNGKPILQPNQGNQPNPGQPVIPTRRRSIIRSE